MKNLPVYPSGQTASGQCSKICHFSRLQSLLLSLGHNCSRERMLTLLLERVSHAHQLRLTDSVSRDDIGNRRFAFGDGSGLVKSHNLYSSRVLKGLRGLEQYSVSRAHPVSDHDRHRSGKSKCTGAGNDENADGPLKGKCRCLSEKQPDHHHRNSDQNNRRHKNSGNSVGDSGNRSLRRRCVADHLNDL